MSKTDYEFIIFFANLLWWKENGGTSMVERCPPHKRWWKEVPLLSSSEGAFFLGVITILLQGVINVLVYEAPKELS